MGKTRRRRQNGLETRHSSLQANARIHLRLESITCLLKRLEVEHQRVTESERESRKGFNVIAAPKIRDKAMVALPSGPRVPVFNDRIIRLQVIQVIQATASTGAGVLETKGGASSRGNGIRHTTQKRASTGNPRLL